jgi:cobalt-zinc-cadmium efflux system membrane fusion protein
MALTFPAGAPRRLLIPALLAGFATAGAVAFRFLAPPPETPSQPEPVHAAPAEAVHDAPSVIEFPKASWQAAAIRLERVSTAPLDEVTTLTGKIGFNEDRIAHVYPLVEGRVDEVDVSLGDTVTKGQQLVVIQSREVGQSMLQLAQDRLQLDFAKRKNEWTQSVTVNTLALIKLLRANATIEEIEAQLRNRPLGEYRDQLMTAYIEHATSRKNLDRLAPLQSGGIIAARQVFEAEATWTTARASLQSLLEQIEQESKQAAVLASQTVKELETRVAVDETALKILGFDDKALATVEPTQGEALAHCPIHAPLDGTVISKDIAILEHVGPTKQILAVADMKTVWLVVNVYEEHLPLLRHLVGKPVRFRSDSWPGQVFEARVFYTGDVVDSETRAMALRAEADNADGMLKPGMFVTVELPGAAETSVLQVPLSAAQEHEGRPFVFVHLGGDRFERRDVVLGRRNTASVEIRDGLATGEEVVVGGGFALKSRMLAELLAE